jgi:hypothetical protein
VNGSRLIREEDRQVDVLKGAEEYEMACDNYNLHGVDVYFSRSS